MTEKDYRFHTINILTELDLTHKRLSLISSHYLNSRNVNSQLRPTITYLTQEITRQRGFLDTILSRRYHGNFNKLDKCVRNILRLGAFEIIFRESVPPYASVNSAVQLTKKVGSTNLTGVVNAILRQLDPTMKPDLSHPDKEKSVKELAFELSHPEWMIKRWITQYGYQNTVELCIWNNQSPVYTIRRNRLQIDQDEFELWLNMMRIKWERSQANSHFYMIDQASKLRISDGFLNGYFTFQDISAGIVSKLAYENYNEVLLDVCCAPGGKISYLAELMGNKGSLFAYDVDERRLDKVRENIARLNLNCIQLGLKDATKDDFPESDLILLDVPCSGTGVMAKRADLRWRRCEKNILEMATIQKNILNHMVTYLIDGGKLIYSTCSLEHEENWGVINSFLKFNKNFQVVKPKQSGLSDLIDNTGALVTFPPRDSMDGVFAVVLERIG